MSRTRIVFLVTAILFLVSGLTLASLGDLRGAVASALLAGGALVFATWALPTSFPGRGWIGYALIAAGFGVLWSPLGAGAAFLVFVVLKSAFSLTTLHRLERIELEVVDAGVISPESAAAVTQFEALGLRGIGGFRGTLGRKTFTVTVLAGPELDRYAGVTGLVADLTSHFGDRQLLTVSSALAPRRSQVLRQEIHGSPEKLLAAHQVALDLLARRGLRPERFRDDAELLGAARAAEERGLRQASRLSVNDLVRVETRMSIDEPPLADDEQSDRRIEAWLRATQ